MASGLDLYLRGVISAESPLPGVGPSMLRGFLSGCARLYDAGLEGYLAAERTGLRRRDRLPVPVISVGNLTVGGTGKTPMTAMLCRRLHERGLRVTILSRGHGGSSNDARIVSDPDGAIHLSPSDAGDEPVLLARLCPSIPVVVGKDRRDSGREAMRHWPVDVFVLDDGFQFWQLTRDLDIVLLDSRLPFDNGHPLPRGLLREPARHLARAGMAVVTRADRLDASGRNAVTAQIHSYAPEMPVYFASHKATALVAGDREISLDTLSDAKVVTLSAIAQPASFARSLTSACGCNIVKEMRFEDHHVFTTDDVKAAETAATELGAEALVMTEKDAVKWPANDWTSSIHVYALRIAIEVEDAAGFVGDVVARSGVQ